MSDIPCRVCGEPWDAYGVFHGDMAKWEATLFRKGAGCPCCKGKCERDHTEEHMRAIIIDGAWDDPHAFSAINNPDAPRPEWKRPEDKVEWKCEGCDTEIRRSAEDEALYYRSPSRDRHRYAHALSEPCERDAGDLDEWLQLQVEIDGKRYCEACAGTCDDCGCGIFHTHTSATGTVLYGDTYDAGAGFPHPDYCTRALCVDCLEAIPTCEHCGQTVSDGARCCEKESEA